MTLALPRPGLDPRAYFASDHAEIERGMWDRTWVAVAYSSDLAEPESFVTSRLGDTEVFVRRGRNGLAAFVNRCAHRGKCLLDARRGSGPVRCGFHGWSYDDEGRLVAAPLVARDVSDRLRTRPESGLESLQVDTCGAFVFVARPGVAPLAEYLGDEVRRFLLATSALMVASFARETQHWRANWKVAVESVLESLHVPFLHRETFASEIDARSSRTWLAGRHSFASTVLGEETRTRWEAVRRRFGAALPDGFDEGAYEHVVVFPSLAIGITAGTVASTQFYAPVDPSSSELEYALWCGWDDTSWSTARTAMSAAVRDGAANASAAILVEDRSVCEGIQRAVRSSPRRAVLVPGEERIAAFHDAWSDYVGSADA